jgi:hypothetical protein
MVRPSTIRSSLSVGLAVGRKVVLLMGYLLKMIVIRRRLAGDVVR